MNKKIADIMSHLFILIVFLILIISGFTIWQALGIIAGMMIWTVASIYIYLQQ